MKIVKWLVYGIIFLAVLLAVTALAIPYFFKDDIFKVVKKEMNDRLDAKVDFDNNIGLTLFRSFPDLSVHISDIKVVGKNEFKGLQLAHIKDADVNLDLMSVIKNDRPIEVHSFELDRATIYVKILENGKANYNITKPTKTSTTSSSGDYKVKLASYRFTKSNITFDDEASNTFVEMKNLYHKGSGDFTSTIYDLVTTTKADQLSVSNNGIKYINRAKTDIDLTLNVDTKKSKYTIKDNDIKLNALRLTTSGEVEMPGDDIVMNIKFKAPETDFKYLLSMVPSAYTKNFENVDASGKMAFKGNVKGKYNENSLPAFNVNLEIDNGKFKYPDLPMGVTDINTKVAVKSPGSDLDRMTVNIPSFHMKLGDNPVDGSFALRTPISDPDVKTKLKGIVNLESLSKAFPLDGVEKLKGLIDADVDIDTKMSYVESKQYDRIDMKGDFKMKDIDYIAKGMPPVKIKDMQMAFTPKHVEVNKMWVKLGKSDVKADGRLDNILAYFSPNLTMKGDLNVRSDYFDANEWLEEEDPNDPTANYQPDATNSKEAFDRFDFNINANFKKIDYETYTLENTVAKGNFTPQSAKIDKFNTKIGESDIAATGTLDNVYNYLYENADLKGNLRVNSKKINLNELSSSEETTASTTEISEPILIPENLDINLATDINHLIYDNMDFKGMTGNLKVKNERVSINDFEGGTMGGQFAMDGFYDTKKKENPKFQLDYDMKKMDFQKTFKTLNSVKQIAPIAEFIEGLFSTSLSLKGNLKQDMSVDYNTLTGDGIFNTLNAVIKNFKPLADIGAKMNLRELKNLEIVDTKNWFELVDGKVVVKPFETNLKDTKIAAQGSHGITKQDMNYEMKFTVPRDKLEKSSIGSAANTGIGLLGEQAKKLGLNIAQGDNINFMVFLKGSVTKPKINIKLLGTSGKSVQEEVVDQVKEVAEEKVEEVKDKAQEQVNEQVDKVTDKVDKEVDKVVDKGTEIVKDKVGEVIGDTLIGKIDDIIGDKVGGKVGEVLGDGAKEELDKLKDKIKLPFGGKNKNKKGKN